MLERGEGAAARPGTSLSEATGKSYSLLVYILIVCCPMDARTEKGAEGLLALFLSHAFFFHAFVIFSRFRHGKGDCFFNRCLAVHTFFMYVFAFGVLDHLRHLLNMTLS